MDSVSKSIREDRRREREREEGGGQGDRRGEKDRERKRERERQGGTKKKKLEKVGRYLETSSQRLILWSFRVMYTSSDLLWSDKNFLSG